MKNQQTEKEGGLVYSTESGRMCPGCNKPVAACVCRQKMKTEKRDGVIRVGRETQGRKGKGVTVITGVRLSLSELNVFAKHLKQKCGSGGTVKNGVIEIQGDHRTLLIEELKKQGWTVKRSGG